ncbi:MAG: autotransporter outer membrane beta-barrel domain-containing protein [Thiobacillus sp.]
MALNYSIDFAPSQKLGGNQSAIGNYVNAIQQAGGSQDFNPILNTLLSMPDDASLARAYDQLSPEPLLATSTTAVKSDLRFSDALHSCRVREGEFRFVSEGECSWVRLTGSKLDQDRTDTNLGFNRKTNTLAAGAQKRVNQNWSAGFGFSIDTSTLHVSDNTRSEGNQYALGVIAKRNLGADAFTASLNLGYGPYDTTRLVNLTGPVVASSKQNVGLASAHVRWSRDYEHKNVWYLRPLLDVGVTHVYHGAFDEQGAGVTNLSAKSGRDTLVSLQPGLEFGREFATAGGTLIRPFGMVGLTHFVSGATTGVTASLQGAPVGTAPFTTESTMDKNYADLTLGVDTLSTGGAVFRISYTGQYSEHTESHSASLKVAIPF